MKALHRRRRTAGVMFTFGFRASPLWMTLTLLADLTAAIIIPLQPYTFKLFMDALLRHHRSQLVVASVLVGGAAAVQWMVRVLASSFGIRLGNRCVLYTTTRIAQLVNAVPGIEHLERPDYLQELDLLRSNQVLLGQAPRQTIASLQVIVQLAGIGLLLGTVSPILVLLPLLGFVPFLAESRSVGISERINERLSEPVRLANALFTLSSTAAPAKELRVFGLAQEVDERHGSLAASIAKQRRSAAIRALSVTAAGWFVFASGFIGAGAYVLIRTVDGRSSIGQLFMTLGLFQILRVQLSQVLSSITAMLTAAQTAHRLLWLEDYAARCTAAPLQHQHNEMLVPDRLASGIRFDGVSFTYPGSQTEALRRVDLFIRAGTTVAIVGENGAGKSTLIKLLTRMYEPTAGMITVDGADLSNVPVAAWRRRISAAFQDVVPYELTAGEAIGIGNLDRMNDSDALDEAVERASAKDVLAALDRGYDTTLGRSFPGGRELSGGQWQKLALARAMMRPDALLVVFDEPTAALDAHTEHALFASYAAAARRTARDSGTITILTSHRFSTVGMADVIVVVDDGRIVEHGSHSQLMANRGLYAELYDLQAASYR